MWNPVGRSSVEVSPIYLPNSITPSCVSRKLVNFSGVMEHSVLFESVGVVPSRTKRTFSSIVAKRQC